MPDRIPAHGTPGRYQGPRRHTRWQACRCAACRAAALRMAKAQQLRRLRRIPGYMDRVLVAAHTQKLLDAGWTRQEIAAAAQVSRKTAFNVLNSNAAAVQFATAQVLLRLRPQDAPSVRPAIGATRRVRALCAMGWPLWWQAQRVGLSETGLRSISSGRTRHVSREHFDAINRVYRTHCMQLGPSEAARKAARAKQWATAAAWNDIDDPNDRPHSVIGQCERRRAAA